MTKQDFLNKLKDLKNQHDNRVIDDDSFVWGVLDLVQYAGLIGDEEIEDFYDNFILDDVSGVHPLQAEIKKIIDNSKKNIDTLLFKKNS